MGRTDLGILPRSSGAVCRSQPFNNQCCSWTGPFASCYDYRIPSAIPSGNLGENIKCLLPVSPRNYMAYRGPHREVTGRQRERENGPGVLLLMESTKGPMVSKSITLLVNLKHKSRNSHHGKRNKQVAK